MPPFSARPPFDRICPLRSAPKPERGLTGDRSVAPRMLSANPTAAPDLACRPKYARRPSASYVSVPAAYLRPALRWSGGADCRVGDRYRRE